MKQKFCPLLLTLMILIGVATPAQASASTFTDVPENHWANSYVEQAYAAGWVRGMGGGRYEPKGTLTRAQFLTMMTNAFYGGDVVNVNVPNGSPWYAACWSIAQTHKLHEGTSMKNLSDLTSPISRYDMAQVIINILSGKGISASAAEAKSAQTKIQDWSNVPSQYRNAVADAYALGIINGRSGNFAGQETMNRAEGATVLCRIEEAITKKSGSTQTPPTQPPAEKESNDSPKPSTTQDPDPSTQTPTEQPANDPDELTAEVVRLVNIERAKESLAPLGTYDSLTKAAQTRAPELVTLFSHDRPDGTNCFTALDATGAKQGAYTWGENIAAGHASAAETVEQWMNSPGHRANIMNPDFTHIGVGYQYDSNSTYSHYWVQMFVGTSSAPDKNSTESSNDKNEVPDTDTQTPEASDQTSDSTTQTPDSSSQTTSTPDELTAEVIRLVNVERAKENLAPLGTYESLTKAAQIRAPELVTLFSHDRPDGTECFTALDATGASKNAYTMGENIAAGSATAAGVVEQWMNSPGHRANIMNPDFTHIGVGYQQDSSGIYGYYWVQMFVGTSS